MEREGRSKRGGGLHVFYGNLARESSAGEGVGHAFFEFGVFARDFGGNFCVSRRNVDAFCHERLGKKGGSLVVFQLVHTEMMLIGE